MIKVLIDIVKISLITLNLAIAAVFAVLIVLEGIYGKAP